MSVGFPAHLYLHLFGQTIEAAFGHIPYQVGSSLIGKGWRDVDVVLILPDDEFEAMFPGLNPEHGYSIDTKWSALCMAFSALGERMTGLPIDFKIQQQTNANEKHKGIGRGALGLLGPLNRVETTSAGDGS